MASRSSHVLPPGNNWQQQHQPTITLEFAELMDWQCSMASRKPRGDQRLASRIPSGSWQTSWQQPSLQFTAKVWEPGIPNTTMQSARLKPATTTISHSQYIWNYFGVRMKLLFMFMCNQTSRLRIWTKAAPTHPIASTKQSTRMYIIVSQNWPLWWILGLEKIYLDHFEAVGRTGLLSSTPTPTLGQLERYIANKTSTLELKWERS